MLTLMATTRQRRDRRALALFLTAALVAAPPALSGQTPTPATPPTPSLRPWVVASNEHAKIWLDTQAWTATTKASST